MKECVCVFLVNEETQEIVLALKKRGFGVGKINGAGGKLEGGETPAEAAVRETHEEFGVLLHKQDLVEVANINFHFAGHPESDIHSIIYVAHTWSGVPQETEEMAPQLFSLSKIPYEKMWADDTYWLPHVLKGDYIKATFHFNTDGESISSYTIEGAKRP